MYFLVLRKNEKNFLMWVVTDQAKRKHVLAIANLAFGVQHPTPHVPVDNPVSLDREGLKLLQQEDYIVSYKADGTRYLLVMTLYQGRPLAALVDRAGKTFSLHVQAQWSHFQRNSVFDGELCTIDQSIQHFLIFNALIDQGISLTDLPYPQRLQYVQNNFPAHPLTPEERQNTTTYIVPMAPALHFVCKEWDFARNMRAMLRNIMPRYAIDGFVLTPVDQPVISGRNPALFKWKHDHPIDVRVIIQNKQMRLEVDDHGTPVPLSDMFPFITFEPDDEWNTLFAGWLLYDQIMTNNNAAGSNSVFNQVVEMTCIPKSRGFVLQYMRLRPDKEGPNNTHTVKKTLQSIQDAITQDELFAAVGKS